MTENQAPSITAVRSLLQQSGLPVEDLETLDLGLFVCIGDPESPDGIAGVELAPDLETDLETDLASELESDLQSSLKSSLKSSLAGDPALLRSVVVRRESRARGLGRDLVAKCEGLARRQGVDALYLLTETAAEFFRSIGYREIDRGTAPDQIKATSQFSSLCPDSAILMFKSLK